MLPNILPFHRLASGRVISAGQVVKVLRVVRSQPLSTHYRETFTSAWDGGNGYDVLRAFSGYCQNEINRRGGLVVKQDTPATFDRTQRKLCERARPSECKWCGRSVGEYVPSGRAFCDASCVMSYRS
jgi:hypothetical protein